MTLPKHKDIEVPLLEEIAALGGEARPADIYPRVTARFPQITDAERKETQAGGTGNKWQNRINWVKLMLVHKGELESPDRGIWKITPKAGRRARLGAQPPPLPPPPSNEPEKVADQIRELVDRLLELASRPGVQAVPGHDELVKMGLEMGQKLGKVSEPGSVSVYKYDVWWKDGPYKQPSLVIEVCDKGNLDKDIQSLNWAWQNLGARGVLVVVDEKDYLNALSKLPLGSSVFAIRAADFVKLHSVVGSAGKEVIKLMFGI